jgi:hypothetical protein
MLNWQPIGDTYPTTEDARALIRVLQSYRPVLSEGSYLLFQHQKNIRESIPATPPTISIPLQSGSATPVPLPSDAWFAKVDVKLTFYGKLYSLLFRPPQLKLEVGLSDGSNKEYVLARDIARSGFMLSPALDTNTAYLAWLQGDRSRYVTSVKLLQQKVFNHRAFKVDGPLRLYPLALPHHYAPTLALYADWYPGFNHIPASVSGSSRIYSVDGKPVMFLPSPGLLTFHLPPGTYDVSTQYGLMPNALTNPGCLAAHADGFGIEIGVQGGTQTPLSAYIDPFKDPARKYDKNISGVISLKAGQLATVAITTGPPGSNGSCDWAWIRDLKFTPQRTKSQDGNLRPAAAGK